MDDLIKSYTAMYGPLQSSTAQPGMYVYHIVKYNFVLFMLPLAISHPTAGGILFWGCPCICLSVITWRKFVSTISYKLFVGIIRNVQLWCSWRTKMNW